MKNFKIYTFSYYPYTCQNQIEKNLLIYFKQIDTLSFAEDKLDEFIDRFTKKVKSICGDKYGERYRVEIIKDDGKVMIYGLKHIITIVPGKLYSFLDEFQPLKP